MPIELRRPERTFTIRQLCLEFKVTPRALRFYERHGFEHAAALPGLVADGYEEILLRKFPLGGSR